jgi:hypothetical protein
VRPSAPPLQDYLPPVLHATFLAAATEFVWLPWKAAMEESLALEGATQGGSQAVRDAQQSAEAQAGWLREALSRQFTDKLLKQVGQLGGHGPRWGIAGMSHCWSEELEPPFVLPVRARPCLSFTPAAWCLPPSLTAPAALHPTPQQVKHMTLHIGAHDGQPDHAFPRLAGSHLGEEALGTPALAFVRALCHLYALDGAVLEQVGERVGRWWGLCGWCSLCGSARPAHWVCPLPVPRRPGRPHTQQGPLPAQHIAHRPRLCTPCPPLPLPHPAACAGHGAAPPAAAPGALQGVCGRRDIQGGWGGMRCVCLWGWGVWLAAGLPLAAVCVCSAVFPPSWHAPPLPRRTNH